MANDIEILFGLIIFLLLCGFVTPFINAEFSLGEPSYSADSLTADIDEGDAQSSLSAFNIISSMFLMFFWTFGQVPLIVEITILLPVRLAIAFIIARNVWIGGGA